MTEVTKAESTWQDIVLDGRHDIDLETVEYVIEMYAANAAGLTISRKGETGEVLPCPSCGDVPQMMHAHGQVHLPKIYWCECAGMKDADYEEVTGWNNRARTALANTDGGWRDIESAPKDRKSILVGGGVWLSDTALIAGRIDPMVLHQAQIATFKQDPDDDGFDWEGELSGGHDEYYRYKPTHWRPLPTPPTEAE